MKWRNLLLMLTGLMMLAVLNIALAGGDDRHGRKDRIEVVAPGKTLFGKSYNELASKWSNWLQKEPPETNPAFDGNGEFCDLNQRGKIWFLAGTFGGVAERTCDVPKGKGIFFPIFAGISYASEFAGVNAPIPCDELTEELDQVRCDVNDDIAIAPDVGLTVIINGKPVSDLYAYRAQSERGGFTFELGPLFAAFGREAGDRFPAVADGYWILLKPLLPGEHTVYFAADFDNDGSDDLGAHYTLFVNRHNGDDDKD